MFVFFVFGIASVVGQTIVDSGVSCEDKKNIIDLHNSLRRTVANGTLKNQPEASNMQRVVWNDGLEETAQYWANNMEFKHNPDRSHDLFDVGENIFIYYTTNKKADYDWNQAIQSWFDEHEIYKYKPLVHDPKTGHYTQMVWAHTRYVGCGATQFLDDKGWKNILYVCNYGPTGNYIGEYPYKIGPGCEKLCCKEQCGILYGLQCEE